MQSRREIHLTTFILKMLTRIFTPLSISGDNGMRMNANLHIQIDLSHYQQT